MKSLIIVLISVLASNALAQNLVVIDLNNHLWILYSGGEEKARGQANGGRRRCPTSGLNKDCRTPIGSFPVLRKWGQNKRSNLYPIDCVNKKKCGARMPWFQKFHHSGAGIHGRPERLTGRNESHGCVRVSNKDAHFLHQHLNIGDTVEVLPYFNH